MKNTLYLSVLALLAMLLSSCGGQSEKKETTATKEQATAQQVCTYMYDDGPVAVEWVAYKYSEKTAVSGTFEEVSVSSPGAGSPAEALNGASIEILTASSNSGDPTRDPKIKETFFGSLEGGEKLSGKITSAEGNDQGGNVTADITMNGITKPVEGSFEVSNDQVELKFELNVETWSAGSALDALNTVCEDLHKGADGESVLWPDVTVYVTTSLTKDCE